MNLTEVVAQIGSYARKNRYKLILPIQENNFSKVLTLNCSNVTLIGKAIGSSQEKRYRIGRETSIASNYSETDLSATFYCSQDYIEEQFFKNWKDKIYNEETQRFSFLDDYARDLEFIAYDSKNKPKKIIKLEKAYPESISQLTYDYTPQNDVMTFNVTFKHRKVKEDYPNTSRSPNLNFTVETDEFMFEEFPPTIWGTDSKNNLVEQGTLENNPIIW